jgi:hypothetical protein
MAQQFGQQQPQGWRGVWARASLRRRAAYVAGGVVVVIVLAALFHPDDSSADDASSAPAPSTSTTPSATAPAYKVLRHDDAGKTGRADLLLPGATKASAEAAIRDYAKGIDGPLSYSVQVVRSDSDGTYVCDGEWRKDARAAGIYGGKAGLTINCP